VLVTGAAGGVGIYAVQLAKIFGAEVTGLCSTKNIDFVKSLGADRIIDYKKEELRNTNDKWDIIFDNVVGKTSFSKYKTMLNSKGYYLAVAGGLTDMLQMIISKISGNKKVVFGGGESSETKESIKLIKDLIESQKLKPFLDKTFTFEEIINAHKYVESGQKKGNIAIKIE
jgi:NADPH:quinone reductase-like Zn-dependent oxidoreductase